MKVKIKRVLAFAMTLTMLLGCFVFGTSAAEAPGTGDIVCSGTDSGDGVSFVVRTGDINGVDNGYTMYLYSNGSGSGWGRPISATQWGTPTFDTNFTGAGSLSVADWCKANVTTLVVHSGVVGFAGDAFKGYTKLEYVEVNTASITDVSTQPLFFSRGSLFESCPLKAIYQTGDTPVDGVADLTFLKFLGTDSQGQRTPFYGNNTTIETVELGSEVYFYTPDPFNGLNGLEKVIIEATDAAKVTAPSSWFNANWSLKLPAGCTVECANQAVAEKFSSITYFDDTMVTYPGKTPAMSEIAEKESTDGKLTYSISEVGDDWVLTVGTTAANTTKEATKLSEAVAEYDTVKSFVTKVVFADSVSIIGKGVCNGWTAIKEVVLPAKDITMNGAETFMNCGTITSIHPANIEKIDGVADLSNVIEFTGAWGGGWAFQGVPISTFVIGETVTLDCANLFAGSGSIKKIVFLGASNTSYTHTINQFRFGISELIVERWNETVNLPYFQNAAGSANINVKYNTVPSKYAGYQTRVNATDSAKHDIRFVAVIGEVDAFDKVGFDIEVSGKDTITKDTTTVYSGIAGTNKNGTFTYTAEQLGGKYVYTLTITGVPASEAIEFTVKPYVVKTGSVEKTYGVAGTVTIGGAN